MNQIQRKRVKRFIKFIRKIPIKNFNLDVTGNIKKISPGDTEEPDIIEFAKRLKNHQNGVDACCVGFLPLYNNHKFKWCINKGHIDVSMDGETCGGPYDNPWNILAQYFGLTQRYIFQAENYNKQTPNKVADELEKLLKE